MAGFSLLRSWNEMLMLMFGECHLLPFGLFILSVIYLNIYFDFNILFPHTCISGDSSVGRASDWRSEGRKEITRRNVETIELIKLGAWKSNFSKKVGESLNDIETILEGGEKPILVIAEKIRMYLMLIFAWRGDSMKTWHANINLKIQKIVEKNKVDSKSCTAH